MALRLHTKYKNVNNITYEIFIHDATYVGSVIDFNIGDDRGAVITWQGAEDKLKTPVLTSKLEVNIFIDSADVQTFVDDLNTAYEGQFRIVLKEGSFVERWVGLILPDLVEYEDLPNEQKPVFKVVATDGIKRLKDVPYKDSGGPYTNRESIVQHLIKCISNIGTTDLITYTNWVLITATNWVPASITSGDVLDNTDFDHRALYQIDDRGNYVYPSVYRVIEQLCLRFHARFFMYNGVYYFFQYNYHEETAVTVYRYASNGTLSSGPSSTNWENFFESKWTEKYGGGKYSFFPALRSAEVNYIHFGYINLAKGYVWDDAAQPTIPESPTTYSVPANTSFSFFGVLRVTLTYSGSRPYNLRFNYTLQVGTEYLNRVANPTTPAFFGEPSIETTSSTYQQVFAIDLVDAYSYGEIPNKRITWTSPQFTVEGDVSFTIDLDGAYDQQGNAVAGVSVSWKFTDVELTPIPSGDLEEWTNTRRYTGFNATSGNSEKEVINLVVGQEFGFGRLVVDTGAGTTDGIDWGVGATSSGISIEQLLANEYIRTQSIPIRKLTAQVEIYYPDLFKTITHKTSRWILHNCKYITYRGLTDGQWYELDTTGTTSGNTEEDRILDEIDTTNGNDVTPSNPVGGTPTTDDDNTDGTGGANSALDALFPRTNADIASGATVTQIPIETRTVAGEWKAGQTIKVVDPVTGAQQEFTVTADTAVSDTYISVTSTTANFDFRTGSWIITSQEQQGAGGGSAAFFREEFPAHASATITVTENSGNLPSNAAAITVYYDNGQLISKNYWSHSGSNITLTYTPPGAQSIWVDFTA